MPADKLTNSHISNLFLIISFAYRYLATSFLVWILDLLVYIVLEKQTAKMTTYEISAKIPQLVRIKKECFFLSNKSKNIDSHVRYDFSDTWWNSTVKFCRPYQEVIQTLFLERCFCTKFSYVTLPCVCKHINMGLIGVKFDVSLVFISFHSIISFVIPPAHDMEFWGFKMLILLKFYLFISSVLYLLCSVLISFKFRKSFICNFLKFCESMTSMMRICLLWASANGILLWKL